MSLSLRTGQKTQMKQQMALRLQTIQIMNLLQLPTQKLQEHLLQALKRNPALMVVAPGSNAAEETQAQVANAGEISSDTVAQSLPLDYMGGPSEAPRDDAYQYMTASQIEDFNERRTEAMQNVAERTESLQDSLLEQVRLESSDDETQAMAERLIIEHITPRGFLEKPLKDLVSPEELPLAERALRLIQKLEPTGVGAENEQQSLLLQLAWLKKWGDSGLTPTDFAQLELLISRYYDRWMKNRLPDVSLRTGIPIARLYELREKLERHFTTDPGQAFRQTERPARPDLFCVRLEDGSYQVVLDSRVLPQIQLNEDYAKAKRQKGLSKEEKDQIAQNINEAKMLINALDVRQTTLKQIAQAAVNHQTDFLEHGEDAQKPLKMRDIADELGLALSTVSRAVAGKWIQTPRGMFMLRRFFSAGVGDVSRNAIKAQIRRLIDEEDKTHPLSDAKIAEMLGGIVSRSGVKKYRLEMGIPSSRGRKIWK